MLINLKSTRGFSFAEIMVSLAIFGLFSLAIMVSISSLIKSTYIIPYEVASMAKMQSVIANINSVGKSLSYKYGGSAKAVFMYYLNYSAGSLPLRESLIRDPSGNYFERIITVPDPAKFSTNKDGSIHPINKSLDYAVCRVRFYANERAVPGRFNSFASHTVDRPYTSAISSNYTNGFDMDGDGNINRSFSTLLGSEGVLNSNLCALPIDVTIYYYSRSVGRSSNNVPFFKMTRSFIVSDDFGDLPLL